MMCKTQQASLCVRLSLESLCAKADRATSTWPAHVLACSFARHKRLFAAGGLDQVIA